MKKKKQTNIFEFEPIEFDLPWQRPEFWQEQDLKQERSKRTKQGRSKENLHLNNGRTTEK